MPHMGARDNGRTISYDLINSFNSIVHLDRVVEQKVSEVKERYRSREKENIEKIKTLSNKLKEEEH